MPCNCSHCAPMQALQEKIERLRAALEEIAKETGTPYARIASEALRGTR